MTSDRRCSGPVSRRSLLQVGALALGGLSLRDLLSAQSASSGATPDTSVILLYLHGGPSQLETYDLKPDAPLEYRSIYRPIATNVPGLDICEKFPLQAKLADKFSLVRSLTHDVGIHSDGGIIVLTGKRPTVLDPTSGSKSEHPDFGSIASRVRGPGRDAVPPYVAIPSKPYMTQPTYLGMHHAPMDLGDPSREDFRPPYLALTDEAASKLGDRRTLLAGLDRFRRDIDRTGQLGGTDEFRSRAMELLTSTRLAEAFQLNDEPAELRDRYGRNLWGQSCLMARRLAEAGTAVVSIFFDTPRNGDEFTNWDDHIANAGKPGHFGRFMDVRLPYMDQALAALIEDVWNRGREHQIMVVVVGEFGRTPRLSSNANGVGRDHWPQAMSALVSGGGLRMGQVVGASNSKAEYPTECPYSPQDLLATVYRHLKINPDTTFNDHSGRPIAILPSGSPIPELVA